MELSISRQAVELLCFFAAGFALGLIYDLLRPIRHSCKRGWGWDAVFCFSAAAVIFCFSMGVGSGRLGIWDILGAMSGFCLYINLLSRFILPLIEKAAYIFKKLIYSLKTLIKNSLLFCKKNFQKLRQ